VPTRASAFAEARSAWQRRRRLGASDLNVSSLTSAEGRRYLAGGLLGEPLAGGI